MKSLGESVIVRVITCNGVRLIGADCSRKGEEVGDEVVLSLDVLAGQASLRLQDNLGQVSCNPQMRRVSR